MCWHDAIRFSTGVARCPIVLPLMLMEGGGVANVRELKRKVKRREFRLYCLMLYSDLDKNFISFVSDTRDSISVMSGEDVFVFWFEHLKEDIKILFPNLKKTDDSLGRNHSLKVAQTLEIPNSNLPCLIFFQKLESNKVVAYSFDNNWEFNHMSEHMKAVFDAVSESLAKFAKAEDEKLLKSIEVRFRGIRIKKWVKRISSRQSLQTLLKAVATGASFA